MLLFSHPERYIWSPSVYILIGRYGLYPAFEKAGISPEFVLNAALKRGWKTKM
jgi:hypothetical protein